MAGKSTLNRLELSKLEPTRYHKISHNPMAIKNLLVDLFVEAHARPPKQIINEIAASHVEHGAPKPVWYQISANRLARRSRPLAPARLRVVN